MDSYSNKQFRDNYHTIGNTSAKNDNKILVQRISFEDNRLETRCQKKQIDSINQTVLPNNPKANPKSLSPHADMSHKPASSRQGVVLQRLTGMEVEVNVPFYGTCDTSDPEHIKPVNDIGGADTLNDDDRSQIANFLWGGLSYGTSYGKEEKCYDISADHGNISRLINEFGKLLILKNKIQSPDSFRGATRMEYRTLPFEERSEQGNKDFATTVHKMKEHVSATITKAKQNNCEELDSPLNKDKGTFGTLYTGIPKNALNKLASDDTDLKTKLSALMNFDPIIYIQTTTGTLPSEIPDLFRETRIEYTNSNDKLKKSMALLMDFSIDLAKQVIIGNAQFLSCFAREDINSLRGWLTLIAQYLLAYNLELTGLRYTVSQEDPKLLIESNSTSKNLVVYLSKTSFGDAIKSLPEAIRPNIYGDKKEGWMTLFTQMVDVLNSYDIARQCNLAEYNSGYMVKDTDGQKIPLEHSNVLGYKTPRKWLFELLERYSPFNQKLEIIPQEYVENARFELDENDKTARPEIWMTTKASQLAQAIAQATLSENQSFLDSLKPQPGELNMLNGWLHLISFHLCVHRLDRSSFHDTIKKSQKPTAIDEFAKTPIMHAINQIPQRVRPNITDGAHQEAWKAFMNKYLQISQKHNILNGNATLLNGKSSLYGESDESKWIESLFGYSYFYQINTGHSLELDIQQKGLQPPLLHDGEQAIPLEDRHFHLKSRYLNARKPEYLEQSLRVAWDTAVSRRLKSTKYLHDFQGKYGEVAEYIKKHDQWMSKNTYSAKWREIIGYFNKIDLSLENKNIVNEFESLDGILQKLQEVVNECWQNMLQCNIGDQFITISQVSPDITKDSNFNAECANLKELKKVNSPEDIHIREYYKLMAYASALYSLVMDKVNESNQGMQSSAQRPPSLLDIANKHLGVRTKGSSTFSRRRNDHIIFRIGK